MLLLLFALLVLAWVGWRLSRDYVGSAGTLSERVLGAFQNRASLIAARVGAILMAVVPIVIGAADSLGATGLSAFLSHWMTPDVAAFAVALILAGIDWLRTQNFSFEDKAPD